MSTTRAGPASLWLLRHGQSQGNVIRASAAADALELDIPDRDMDVPLSDLGLEQARAFGAWLGSAGRDDLPEAVIASPYRRAVQTAEIVAALAGLGEVSTDERLRERDLGMMDLLTTRGFAARFPAEAAHRERLGKFYYRPPGGESWTDVALRCRSMRDSVALEHPDKRVLLVTHEVVIILFRYLLERLDEQAALSLSQEGAIKNCGLTAFTRNEEGTLETAAIDWTAPVEAADVRLTGEPDDVVASR
jgi:broad specificity phosphatase PhoE